jgi:Family of unknown function (DUF5996)
MALLGYDQFRDADDPRITLLAFLQSAYDAGARSRPSEWCLSLASA